MGRFVGFATLAVLSLAGCRRAAPTPERVTSAPAPSSAMPSVPVPLPKRAVGDIVAIAPETILSDAVHGPPRRRVGGTPALVLESSNDKVRVLAADGSAGWTRHPGALLATATVAWDKPIQAWKYAPEDENFVHQGADLFAANAGPLVGASRIPFATSDQAMKVVGAEFLEQPLLSVQRAFVHPLTVSLRFPVTVDAHLRAKGFSGVVRPPFLGGFSLLPLAPQAGNVTHVLDAKGELRPMPAATHHWTRTHALVIDPDAKAGAIEALAVIGDGGAVAFALSPKTRGASFVLPHGELDSPWLGHCEIVDLDGDGKAEWLVEIVERTSHGVTTNLVVIAGTSVTSSFSARVYPLAETHEGDDPPEYAFWVDEGTAFLARTKIERLAWPAGTLSPAEPVVDAVYAKAEDAVGAASAGDLYAFPFMQGSHVRWAVGRAR